MITREEMENYLRKGGYTDKGVNTEIYDRNQNVWRYKETNMLCNVDDTFACYFDTETFSKDRIIKYNEWSIDPSCGCLKKVEE